jgi:hypothetical protein
MVALVMTAPDGSEIWPTMLPVCAKAALATKETTMPNEILFQRLMGLLLLIRGGENPRCVLAPMSRTCGKN